MSEEPETGLEVDDLASLDIEAIEGIGKKMATRLKSVKINTIEDLETCDPPAVYESAKVSLYKLYELRRKAQMILSVSQALKTDETTLKILGENGYSITKTIEEDLAILQGLTQQSPDHLTTIRDNLLLLLIGLEDHIARRKGSIKLLRRIKRRKRPEDEAPLAEPGTPTPEPDITTPEPEIPTPEPVSKMESPTLATIKGGLSGGVGGLIAGALGGFLELHSLIMAGIGVIVGVGAWFVLHAILKD